MRGPVRAQRGQGGGAGEGEEFQGGEARSDGRRAHFFLTPSFQMSLAMFGFTAVVITPMAVRT